MFSNFTLSRAARSYFVVNTSRLVDLLVVATGVIKLYRLNYKFTPSQSTFAAAVNPQLPSTHKKEDWQQEIRCLYFFCIHSKHDHHTIILIIVTLRILILRHGVDSDTRQRKKYHVASWTSRKVLKSSKHSKFTIYNEKHLLPFSHYTYLKYVAFLVILLALFIIYKILK